MMSFLQVTADSHFSLANVPFGIYSASASGERRPATRIGDTVVDLRTLADQGCFDDLSLPTDIFSKVRHHHAMTELG